MKSLAFIITACCIAVALYLFAQAGGEQQLKAEGKLPDRELTPIESVSASTVPIPTSLAAVPEEAERLLQHMETLQAELRAVVAMRQQAEAALLQAEQDVTDLEHYIEAIKLRGEEPTDYADEGVTRFLPAFEAYQQAVLDLEAATAAQDTIMTQLSEAEKALADHWSPPASLD